LIMAGRRNDFDVMIVGGGMVGACLAALLSRGAQLAGWKIAVIEPTAPAAPREGVVDLRVSALSRASERILRHAGAWPQIEAQACPYTDMVVWDAAGRRDGHDVLRFSAAEAGEPNLGYIAENLSVQWALHESPHVREVTQLGAGLEALEFEGDSARVTLSDGRRYACGLLVGADGGRSRVRELCGIGRAGWSYGQTAVVAHLRTAQPHGGTAWQRFLPDGPIAFLPLRDGRVSMVWTMLPEDAAALQAIDPAEFGRRVTEASDRVLGPVELDSGRAGLPLALWHSREYVRPGLALAGDAAHTIHPLAGQGVNLGFLDAAALVETLVAASAAGQDPFSLRTLRRYERWRRSENALMLGACDSINRLFGAKNVAVAGARRLGLALVAGQPLARRALVQRALGLAGDLPTLVTRPG